MSNKVLVLLYFLLGNFVALEIEPVELETSIFQQPLDSFQELIFTSYGSDAA